MQITKFQDGLVLELKIDGRLDANTAIDFATQVNDYLDEAQNGVILILDFAGVDYISSVGLRVILELQKQIAQKGSMQIKNVIQEVYEIFEMTGFTGILMIEHV